MSVTLRPRKRETDAIAEILESEAEDTGYLAEQVMVKSFELLMARELYVVVTVYPDALWLHGPYFTRKQAEKVLISTAVAPKAPEARVFIRRLITATADGSDDDTLF